MKKLSIFDRKFLASCNVRVEGQRRWSDAIFLQSCGISTTLTPRSSRARINTAIYHRAEAVVC
jgi:hypothetical protein